METNNQSGLTQSDIELREIASRLGDKPSVLPQGLQEALAREEINLENKVGITRVPEPIFVRDILPAISGDLGEVDMRWWVAKFGATTKGFIVTALDEKNQTIELFDFPPMVPSPDIEASRTAKPVGDVLADYRNRVRQRPGESEDELKASLRNNVKTTGGIESFLFNIATVERICRRYGASIISKAKPEFVTAVEEAVAGLNEVLGPLGVYGTSSPVASGLPESNKRNVYDDDDDETGPGSFD